jgi:cytochrome c oxidase subunit 4
MGWRHFPGLLSGANSLWWRDNQVADLTKMSPSEVAEEHATEAHAPYLTVWAVLAVLTLIEYWYAFIFKNLFLILLLGLLFWAVIKAGLVGWFFMHLKYEGNWVYILIVPAFVLATIFVLALTPDMSMQPETEENPGGETSFVVPAIERPGSQFQLRLAKTLPPTGPGQVAGS